MWPSRTLHAVMASTPPLKVMLPCAIRLFCAMKQPLPSEYRAWSAATSQSFNIMAAVKCVPRRKAIFTSLESALGELHAKGVGLLHLDSGLAIANGHGVELGIGSLPCVRWSSRSRSHIRQ